jgi:hypothetical protein
MMVCWKQEWHCCPVVMVMWTQQPLQSQPLSFAVVMSEVRCNCLSWNFHPKGVPPAELQRSSRTARSSGSDHTMARSLGRRTLGRICRAAAGEDAQNPILLLFGPPTNRNIAADVPSRAIIGLDDRLTGEIPDLMKEVTISSSSSRVRADGSRLTFDADRVDSRLAIEAANSPRVEERLIDRKTLLSPDDFILLIAIAGTDLSL